MSESQVKVKVMTWLDLVTCRANLTVPYKLMMKLKLKQPSLVVL